MLPRAYPVEIPDMVMFDFWFQLNLIPLGMLEKTRQDKISLIKRGIALII